MIKRNDLVNHIKNIIEGIANENQSDLTFAFHDEFSYSNDYVDVEVTIKALSGTIINKRISYPVQIIIDVENSRFEEVIEYLMEFSIEENEKFFTYNNDKIKQFFTTPTVLSTFNEDGNVHTTTLTIDGTFIVYEEAIFSDDVSITIDGALFEGITNVVDNFTHNGNTVIPQNNTLAENYTTGIQMTLTIDFDLRKSNVLHKKLITEAKQMNIYEVVYDDGFVEHEHYMEISTLTKQTPLGAPSTAQIIFRLARRD